MRNASSPSRKVTTNAWCMTGLYDKNETDLVFKAYPLMSDQSSPLLRRGTVPPPR
jgi:hypothetical protein